jgi:hypothetical protein
MILEDLINFRIGNANAVWRNKLDPFRAALEANPDKRDRLNARISKLVNEEAGRDEFIQVFSEILGDGVASVLDGDEALGVISNGLNKAIRGLNPSLVADSDEVPSVPLYNFIRDNISHLPASDFQDREGRYSVQKRRGPEGGFILTKESEVNADDPNDAQVNPSPDLNINDDDDGNVGVTLEVEEARREFSYYKQVKSWAEGNDYKLTEIIGGQLTGRKWENPDLIEIYSEYNGSMLQLDFYITSFEVKLELSIDAIWQASNYQRFSHYVYLAIASEDFNENDDSSLRLIDAAVTAGLGILVYRNGGFIRINYPRRNEPTAKDLNELIGRYFNRSFRQDIFERPKSRYAAEKKNLQIELLNGCEVPMKAVFGA